MNPLMVFIGGGLGSLCRYGISNRLSVYSSSFPYGTLVANVLSSLVLGFITGLVMQEVEFISNEVKLLIAVGFCGGFSTYSTFTNETFQFLQVGNWTLAFANVLGNLLVCLLAIFIGMWISKAIL
jgi:CrcB protein